MAPVKPIVHSVGQELPPKGGYPRIDAIRGVRNRGPSGFMIWATMITVNVYGLYKIGLMSKSSRLDRKEKREARMAVQPFFMAEYDSAMAAKVKALKAEERATMKDRKDWVYGKAMRFN